MGLGCYANIAFECAISSDKGVKLERGMVRKESSNVGVS